MNLKEIIQARLAMLAQVGKRISKDTAEAINAAVEALNALLSTEEPTEEQVEQAWMPLGQMLLQGMVTGQTWDGTYQEMLYKVAKAVRKCADFPGEWKYPVWTWPDSVVVESMRYECDKYETYYYRAEYTRDNDDFTFSNIREVWLPTIVAEVQSQFAALDDILIQHEGPPPTPIAETIERGADKAPFLLQRSPFGDIRVQADKASGKVKFSGTATVADVINSYGQVYPQAFWEHHVTEAQDRIPKGLMVGADGHKADAQGYPRLPEAGELTHKFTSLKMDGNKVKFEAETISTQAGKDLAAVLLEGVGLEMSTVVAAKTKKGEFQGQKVDFIQIEGSELFGIDVVLRGASPGSTVDKAKLQAAKEQKQETAMNLEELLQKLQTAIAEGNQQLVATLQGQIDTLKAAQEQAAQPAVLTEEQQALLSQAAQVVERMKQADVIKARDTKVAEVVAKMVTDSELPQQFMQSAIVQFAAVAQTADDVETSKATVLQIMKPLLDAHAEMQTKGFYVPEFNDDGTKKAKVQSLPEAIEELVQWKVATGQIQASPKKTLPWLNENESYMNFQDEEWVLRKMLHSLAKAKPDFAKAYVQMRNGEIKTLGQVVDIMSPQGFKQLMGQTGDTLTTDIAASVPYVFPMMVSVWPQLIAWQLGTVQPLSASTGRIYHKLIKDEDGNDISDVANFTGSYANDPGEQGTVKKIKMSITSEAVTCEIKKLGYDVSSENMRHLATDFGIDVRSDLIMEVANDIAREWNYMILADMLAGATAGNVNYGTGLPTDSSYATYPEWQAAIMDHIDKASDYIYDARFADSFWIIGASEAITRITTTSKKAGLYTGDGQGRISNGVDIVGTINGNQKLVKVHWWNTLSPNKLLIGGRGTSWPETGYIIAPYLGLYVTTPWTDPDTFDEKQSMMSEMARKMVDGKYFATVTIQSGTAGTPI